MTSRVVAVSGGSACCAAHNTWGVASSATTAAQAHQTLGAIAKRQATSDKRQLEGLDHIVHGNLGAFPLREQRRSRRLFLDPLHALFAQELIAAVDGDDIPDADVIPSQIEDDKFPVGMHRQHPSLAGMG